MRSGCHIHNGTYLTLSLTLTITLTLTLLTLPTLLTIILGTVVNTAPTFQGLPTTDLETMFSNVMHSLSCDVQPSEMSAKAVVDSLFTKST